ncbi:metallophosphoesterase family protein [Devosia nitrariae]|uniref:Calcineurin-like phosphoesterase domain-containing protein n=1 Tax=Devosia nitrariae TaxID=2071872 RepID=A0ABQ5WDE2_9HYPH|nr:metallophosphoesterase [Devosia nitrariae]GLQ58101.1 hypothetical protein GCM10010862_53600 [Devosia nitrariae]
MPRIAFIADIHHGEDVLTKKSSQALQLFAQFAEFVAAEQPDLVIDLGDRIADRSHDTDLMLEHEVAAAFASIRVPIRHLCGNHDRDFLSVAENEAILDQSMGHEVVDLGSWQVLVWRADTRIHRLPEGDTFRLADGDLDWLADHVRQAVKPTLVVSHVPLSGQSQRSNYYFHANYGISIYPELEPIQAALREARMPMICVSGHVHWNSLTIVDAIPHVTLQSLSESWPHPPKAAKAWGLLKLSETIDWTAFGRQRFQFSLNAMSTAERGLAPHPPFGRSEVVDAG